MKVLYCPKLPHLTVLEEFTQSASIWNLNNRPMKHSTAGNVTNSASFTIITFAGQFRTVFWESLLILAFLMLNRFISMVSIENMFPVSSNVFNY